MNKRQLYAQQRYNNYFISVCNYFISVCAYEAKHAKPPHSTRTRYALTTREWSGCSSMVTRTVSSGSSSSMSSGHSMKQGAPE